MNNIRIKVSSILGFYGSGRATGFGLFFVLLLIKYVSAKNLFLHAYCIGKAKGSEGAKGVCEPPVFRCLWFTFYKAANLWNLWVFLIAYHRWTYSYALNLFCPNRKRLEVSLNVKYIAVTSRSSKLQVFKVPPGRNLSPGHPRESLNIGKLTQTELWRLVALKA